MYEVSSRKIRKFTIMSYPDKGYALKEFLRLFRGDGAAIDIAESVFTLCTSVNTFSL
jgi:hypothetical protein